MQILNAILGVVLLLFGRGLYWFAVGVLGFLVGVQLAGQWLAGESPALQLLVGVGAGIVGAILAVVFQRVAFAVGGFLAGGYLAVGVAASLGAAANAHLIGFVSKARCGFGNPRTLTHVGMKPQIKGAASPATPHQ